MGELLDRAARQQALLDAWHDLRAEARQEGRLDMHFAASRICGRSCPRDVGRSTTRVCDHRAQVQRHHPSTGCSSGGSHADQHWTYVVASRVRKRANFYLIEYPPSLSATKLGSSI